MRSALTPHTMDTVVRVCVMVMPLACWPVVVVRRPGLTLVVFEARATRRENVAGILAACTREEANKIRAAYGMPPDEVDDWAEADAPALLWVPPDLRLEGWPALQGGCELDRRRIMGEDMSMELACLAAEEVVVTPEPVGRSVGRSVARSVGS